MRGTGTLIIMILQAYASCWAQGFALSEMLQALNASPKQLQQMLTRKGYQLQPGTAAFTIYRTQPDSTGTTYTLRTTQHPYANSITLQHLQPASVQQWNNELLQAGFQLLQNNKNNAVKRYWKDFTTVAIKPDDATPDVYSLTVENRKLPKRKEIRFAEDLLAFNSHQQLALVFGKSNVERDIFLQRSGTEEPCSVLLPGTDREVVFLWNDPENLYGLQQVRVGGNRQTHKALNHTGITAQSSWQSRQGVYPGMLLSQLERYNGEPITTCNNNKMICPDNKGRINFTKIGMELSCLYCPDDTFTEPSQFIATQNASNSSLFVATLMLSPLL